MNSNLIQPPEGDPSLPAVRDFWLEMGRGLVKESIKTIDDTARQVIAIAGILEGLYFHAIAYSDLLGKMAFDDSRLAVYLLPILFLLFSLTAALMVFLPKSSGLELRAWESAKLIHERTLHRKLFFLRIASASLVIGLIILFGAVWLYLLG